jgi:hypothetical protein
MYRVLRKQNGFNAKEQLKEVQGTIINQLMMKKAISL